MPQTIDQAGLADKLGDGTIDIKTATEDDDDRPLAHASRAQSSKDNGMNGCLAKQMKLIMDHLFAEASDIGECDPYVKITLKPLNVARQTEPIYGGGRNVEFTKDDGNILEFDLGTTPVQDCIIKLSVYDEDLGKDDKIGGASIHMKDVLEDGEYTRHVKIIQRKMFAGNVHLHIEHQADKGKLVITLIGCRGLKTSRVGEDKDGDPVAMLKHMSIFGFYVLIVGALFYGIESGGDNLIQTYWDGCWFVVVTTTTVGYGDYYPETATGRYINCFFLVFGTYVLGASLSRIFTFIVAVREKKRRAKGHAQQKNIRDMWAMGLGFLIIMFAGAIFFRQYESLENEAFEDWDVAIQFLFVTVTTVGYGDIGPATQLGRVFGAFFIILGMGLLTQIVSFYVEYREIRRSNKLRAVVMAQSLTSMDEFEYFDHDGASDGEISAFEFLAKMLVYIDACDQKLLDTIMERFKELDIDNSGFLTKEDFISRGV